jgi:hypothetical protein
VFYSLGVEGVNTQSGPESTMAGCDASPIAHAGDNQWSPGANMSQDGHLEPSEGPPAASEVDREVAADPVPADGTDGSNPDVLGIQQHLATHPDEHPNPELCRMARRVPRATRKVKARRVTARRKRSLRLRQLQCRCPQQTCRPGKPHRKTA